MQQRRTAPWRATNNRGGAVALEKYLKRFGTNWVQLREAKGKRQVRLKTLSEFRRLFNIFSQQRAQFVSELEAEVHRLGGNVAKAGIRTGPFDRSWMNLKTSIHRDEASIIAECQRQEEAAVNDYQKVLNVDLPLDVQYVVKRQYMDIKDAYDRIRILQRAA